MIRFLKRWVLGIEHDVKDDDLRKERELAIMHLTENNGQLNLEEECVRTVYAEADEKVSNYRETKQGRKRLASIILIFLIIPIFFGGCEFFRGASSGFSDPVLRSKRDAALQRIQILEAKIADLIEEKKIAAIPDVLRELNMVRADLTNIFKEAEEKSKESGGGLMNFLGMLLSQFVVGSVSYLTTRKVRRGIESRILNPSS